MKIDSDLRLAIRSVLNERKATRNNFCLWKEERKAATALIAAKPRIASIVGRALKNIKSLKTQLNQQHKLISKFGLSFSNGVIDIDGAEGGEERFIKHGGKIPVPPPAADTFDNLMARLATATEPEGKKILTHLGIEWS